MRSSSAAVARERRPNASGGVYDHDAHVHNPLVMNLVIEGGRIAEVLRLVPILPWLYEAQRLTWNRDIGVDRFIAQEYP
jgi:hypothetical protein